jgi:hypothetical protein
LTIDATILDEAPKTEKQSEPEKKNLEQPKKQ